MNVSELMTNPVKTCTTADNLQRAAQIMWEGDCGAVPVVDGEDSVVGMITDRDICMAAYTRGLALWQMQVSDTMSKEVHQILASDRLEAAEDVMKSARVRRVPVLDGGGRLVGIVSMNDLARHAQPVVGRGHKANGLSLGSVARTLAAICEPHVADGAPAAGGEVGRP
jgi:CBS-domain-containing membrane protein